MFPSARKLFSLCCLLLIITSCSHYITDINNKNIEIEKQKKEKREADDAFNSGDYSKSIALYEKIISGNDSNEDTLFYYAESLRLANNAGKAIEQYNKLLQLNKNNLSAIEGKGLAYLQVGDLNKSFEEFNLVLKNDPQRWRTINALGIISTINGKNELAEQYYSSALKLSNNNPSIINNIALGIAFAGDKEKAITLLKDAIAAMQDEGIKKQKLENNLALLYGISGQMAEAETLLKKNLPEYAVYNNLGFYAKIANNKEQATNYLQKAISMSPVYYEKAANNIQDLNNAQVASYHDINPSSDGGVIKKEPTKVWRGTRKLPLPTMRPY